MGSSGLADITDIYQAGICMGKLCQACRKSGEGRRHNTERVISFKLKEPNGMYRSQPAGHEQTSNDIHVAHVIFQSETTERAEILRFTGTARDSRNVTSSPTRTSGVQMTNMLST